MIISGTVRESPSHHHFIFQFTAIAHKLGQTETEATTQFYNFSSSNIATFVNDLNVILPHEHGHNSNFSDFLDLYHRKIEEIFRLEKPKISRRNNKVNPWITEGIVTSIERKHELYRAWVKSKSKSDFKGNALLYRKFRNMKAISRKLGQ